MENILAAMAAGWLLGLSFEGMMQTLEIVRAAAASLPSWCAFSTTASTSMTQRPPICTRSRAASARRIAPSCSSQAERKRASITRPCAQTIPGRVHAMVVIGEIAASLEHGFSDLVPCQRATDMADAVRLATEISRPGDAIILSPGTSSFDMYTGYAQRGDVFCEAVRALS